MTTQGTAVKFVKCDSLHKLTQGTIVEVTHIIASVDEWCERPESKDPDWAHHQTDSIVVAWRLRS